MDYAEQILEHNGVKGMKWGVRKDRGHEGERTKTKKIAKLDKKFDNQNGMRVFLDIHNRAAELSNNHDIDRINNKPQYKNMDFTKDSPLRKQYMNEHQQAFLSNVRKAAAEMGTNASGTKKIDIISDKNGNWEPILTDVKHADATDPLEALVGMTIKVNYDSLGHIVSIEMPGTAVHAEEVDDVLAHFGVKGMKWGHRKARGVETASGGGHHHSSHPGSSEDAARAAELKVKLKTGGPQALSNKELQHVVNRMNLEQQYSKLTAEPSNFSKGQKVVKEVLNVGSTINQVVSFVNSPAGKALKAQLTK